MAPATTGRPFIPFRYAVALAVAVVGLVLTFDIRDLAEEAIQFSLFAIISILVIAIVKARIREAEFRKRKEEEQIIFDSVPAMIFYKDTENRILRVNKSAAESMGMRVEDIEGKSTFDLYPEEAMRYFQDDLKVIKSGQPRLGIIEPYHTPGREMRWVRTDKIPYRDNGGRIIGVIVFAVDIAERVHAEAALQKIQAHLEDLVKERTDSLALANEALRAQIQERMKADDALKSAHADLEQKVKDRTADLEESREQLRALADYQQFVREEERARIAREIHDELGQSLTGLKMDMAWLAKQLPQTKGSAPLHDKAAAMINAITHTIEEVRQISSDLRPGVLDQLGLVAAIEWQAQDFHKRFGIACRFRPSGTDIVVDQERSTALFRMLQEALTNVARHADATQVSIMLEEQDGIIKMDITDNGRGFAEDPQTKGRALGLLGMKERALALGGSVRFEGMPGKGTTVKIVLPLHRHAGFR